MCRFPYAVTQYQHVGCGQCLFCRINQARVWQHRMLLELKMHEYSSFATLTYNEEHLPADGNLDGSHLRNFIKRLRRAIEPRYMRYFGVGEYGDQSWRPHYHLALFGIDITEQELIELNWKKGFVMLGELNSDSARYMTGYITKGMTNKKSNKLGGRVPEFSRMSLKPGIGANAIDAVSERLKKNRPDRTVSTLRHGKKELPLGKYLTDRLNVEVSNATKLNESRAEQDRRSDRHLSSDSSKRVSYYHSVVQEKETERYTIENKRRVLAKGRKL